MKADALDGRAEGNLDRGLVRGVVVSSAARWGVQIVNWGSTILIARMLSPEDYGVVAMAAVLVGLLDLLADFGLGPAIVQAPELKHEDVQRAMGVTCLLGAAAAVLMVSTSSLWAALYSEPRLGSVISVMGMAVMLTAVSAIPYAVLQRRLAFDVLAKAQLVQGLAGAVATLTLAWLLRSYWALIIGALFGKLLAAFFFLWTVPVRPRLDSLGQMRPMLRFGIALTGTRVIWYGRDGLDFAVVGARLGGEALGLYTMALTLARMPAEKLSAAVVPVAFPILSSARNDAAAIRRHYVAMAVATATLVVPASIGLLLTADVLVPVLVGPKWLGAVVPMMVVAAATPMVVLGAYNAPVLNALGKVRLTFRISVLMTAVILPAMAIGTFWGVVGVALAGAVAFVLVASYVFLTTWRLIGLTVGGYFRPLQPVLTSSLGMALAVMLVASVTPAEWPMGVHLLLQILTGLGIYPLLMMTLHRESTLGALRALRGAWSA